MDFFPIGIIPRLNQVNCYVCSFEGISLIRTEYGEIYDLPPQEEGVLLIVSSMVRTVLPERTDLASPGDLIRNERGNIIGCKNLIIN